MKWTKSNVPDYESDRVKVEYIHDYSDRRHLWHQQVIKIDDNVVNIVKEYEDDDWSSFGNSSSCSMPSHRGQWDDWVASLED